MSDKKEEQKQTTNVISLHALRTIKQAHAEDPVYNNRIAQMDKVQLLEEMVRFQEERSREGKLTISLIIRGKVLFKALEEHSETEALRSLTSSYRRHLEYELQDYLQKVTG